MTTYELHCKKTCSPEFRPGRTQTGLNQSTDTTADSEMFAKTLFSLIFANSGLVGWLILNVPVYNFSVMLFFSHVGTEPPLPGYYEYFWGVNVPCSRTQHCLTWVGLEPPISGSGVRGINYQATALPCEFGPRKFKVLANIENTCF